MKRSTFVSVLTAVAAITLSTVSTVPTFALTPSLPAPPPAPRVPVEVCPYTPGLTNSTINIGQIADAEAAIIASSPLMATATAKRNTAQASLAAATAALADASAVFADARETYLAAVADLRKADAALAAARATVSKADDGPAAAAQRTATINKAQAGAALTRATSGRQSATNAVAKARKVLAAAVADVAAVPARVRDATDFRRCQPRQVVSSERAPDGTVELKWRVDVGSADSAGLNPNTYPPGLPRWAVTSPKTPGKVALSGLFSLSAAASAEGHTDFTDRFDLNAAGISPSDPLQLTALAASPNETWTPLTPSSPFRVKCEIGAGLDLSGCDYRHRLDISLLDADVSRSNLAGASFASRDISGLRLADATTTGLDLSGTTMNHGDITGWPLAETTLDNINWRVSGLPASLPVGMAVAVPKGGGATVFLRGGIVAPDLKLAANSRLRAVDLASASLPRLEAEEVDLAGASLVGADLSSSILRGADLSNAILDAGTNLSGSDISGATVTGVDLSAVPLETVRAVGLKGVPAKLPSGWRIASGHLMAPGEQMPPGDYTGWNFDGWDFTGQVFTKDYKLDRTSFVGANLTNTGWETPLPGVNISGATVDGARFWYVRDSRGLRASGLHGTPTWTLPGGTLRNGQMFGTGVDLSKLSLAGWDLSGVRISQCDLTGTDVSHVSFAGADLGNCRMVGTKVEGADLSTARLFGLSSSGLVGTPARLPDGWQILDGHLVGPGWDSFEASFGAADLSAVSLAGLNLCNVTFEGTNLSRTVWTDATVSQVVMRNVSLDGADLTSVHNLSEVRAGGIVGTPRLPAGWAVLDGFLVGPGARLDPWLILEGKDLRGISFDGVLVGSRDLRGVNAAGVSFRSADLVGSRWRSATVTDARFDAADLRSADFSSALLDNASFDGATLDSASLRGANLAGVDLSKAASMTHLSSGQVKGVPAVLPPGWVLRAGYLIGPGSSLRGEELTGVSFVGASLAGADLRGANVASTNLAGLDLRRALLAGVRSGGIKAGPAQLPVGWQFRYGYLFGPAADLFDAQLNGRDLRMLTLRSVNLSGAHLVRAQASGRDFTETILASADLRLARLRNTRWSGAEMTGIALAGSDLRGADLSKALHLTQAALRGTRMDATTKLPAGLRRV